MIMIIKYIVALLVSTSLLVSTVGINLSYHICKSENNKNVSINLFHTHSENIVNYCPFCRTSSTDKLCKMEMQNLQTSCCTENERMPIKILSDNCCNLFSKYIHADLLTNFVKNIENNINIVIHSVIVQLFDNVFTNVLSQLRIQKHYSGISPPQSTDYIHLINSILE